MKRYKVLWIDDDPKEEFMNEAAEYDIDIEVALCHNEGVRLLQSTQTNWDAIILDANCKISSKNEMPSLYSLGESIRHIDHLCKTDRFIPYFIYTGGGYEGYDLLTTFVPRNRDWDDREYYNKPSQRYELFDNLKKAADNQICTQIKHKYDNVFSWIPISDDILKILRIIENNETTNASIFNDIRKVLDWVMDYCNKCGVLPVRFSGSNLGECSMFLGKREMTDFVPLHIQRSFHSCIEIANNGSHRLEIDKAVKSGEAPYLLRSTVFELLNVLYWCKSLPNDAESIEAMRAKTMALITLDPREIVKSEVFEGIIEQDTSRRYFCGEYHLVMICNPMIPVRE